MDHMYIRHTVGGTLFLDTKKHNLTYELTGSDGKWTFTVPAVEEPIADALLKNKDELNPLRTILAEKPGIIRPAEISTTIEPPKC
jgi:hypothetical protein